MVRSPGEALLKAVTSKKNPEWNSTLKFDLGSVALGSKDSVTLRVFHLKKDGRKRLLGQVPKVSLAPVICDSTQPLKKVMLIINPSNLEMGQILKWVNV